MILSAIEAALYIGLLLLIAYTDYKHRRIPNRLLLCLVILRVIFVAVFLALSAQEGVRTLLFSAIAVAITLPVLLLLRPYSKGKTGAGDLKLLLVCGFCLGIHRYLLSLLLSAVFLLIAYVLQHLRHQKHNVPFAPYLCSGALIVSLVTYIFR